ncbi:SNF2-like protein [Catenovulum agarivorans DS-2]|uniref:SNF2-like protein n=1 Tax=Catenovulum agarivorans DS-2 TaxID=1328313 RepID=W7QDU9_9ALTE|nr:DEAD/DEAH box helicase [Catenovulum agarivorans]EWH10091.1 SNF2-like protein [Catenovulum agarivorans DS-2]
MQASYPIAISSNTPDEIEKLYQAYLTLPQKLQCILKIFAVVHKPIGQSKVAQLIKLVSMHNVFELEKKLTGLNAEEKKHLVAEQFLHVQPDGVILNRRLADKLVNECIQQHFFHQLVHLAEQVVPVVNPYALQPVKYDQQRLIRDFFYLGEMANVVQILSFNANPQVIDFELNQVLIELLFIPFELDTMLALSDDFQYQAFATVLHSHLQNGFAIDHLIELAQQVLQANPHNQNLTYLLAEQYLYLGHLDKVASLLSPDDTSCYGLQINASLAFLTGNFAQAEALFSQAIKAKNKFARRKNQYLAGIFGVFYKLCLTALGNQQSADYFNLALEQIRFEQTDKKGVLNSADLTACLHPGLFALANATKYQHPSSAFSNLIEQHLGYYHLGKVVDSLLRCWISGEVNQFEHKTLEAANSFFNTLGYRLFTELAEQLLRNHASLPDICFFPDAVKAKASWDIALEKLQALGSQQQPAQAENTLSANQARLIWEMHISRYQVELKPREQKHNKSGWTKGRAVALKKLAETPEAYPYLSEQDLKICQQIQAYETWGRYGSVQFELEGLNALQAAVGAHNLYLADDLSAPIELAQKDPELLISQQGQQLCLSIADLPQFNGDKNKAYSLKQIKPEIYCLTVFNSTHLQVAEIIGEGGLLIPVEAKEKVLASIRAIAPLLNIQSDLAELNTGLTKHDSDKHLVINIQPFQQGLQFDCVVMPFGEQGPALQPGVGSANITTEINGERIATQRDLIAEQTLLDKLDQACSSFLAMADTKLILAEPQDALATLEQLEHLVKQPLADLPLKLRWPKGKKLSLSQPLGSENMQLAVNKKNEWFEISGELKVDEEQVIELKKLLQLVSSSNGRFIELDQQQVLVLSDDLRRRVQTLAHSTEAGKFHPLASIQVAEATQGMRLKTLHAWETQTQKMYQANKITPQVPSTLQAELRDYQQVGFDWASRLAHWGAGACLADDMGLGKTLQALAVLLSRASQGPSLVIAPTSVCFNWQQEVAKFAPTLNVKLFADHSGDQQRLSLLENLAEFDLVIISYGLLQRESDKLANVRWQTIIADEAQALKNPLAKRSKAAFQLKGEFKMITTGTPIENDLTELWSLFKFVNPGLLGNLKEFGRRFIQPIANAKEDKIAAHKARQSLKTLIAPFILRRMKNQVLTELPPRTDINLAVELSSDEQNFYQALRLTAIDNISQAAANSNAAEHRIKMLAELTKLRQACCNAKLVMAESTIPSAKLAALDELLDELQQNKHKALIFSQFVGHLQLIKQHIENKGLSYQYLDGSTPQKQRQQAVNAFQNGEGDVFLISLKAGGSGLNLTAADYVIHMDPWWNPAVEEQASDRAHRLGQQRPVTIYRLIAKNTIEEKIVALHQNKRDLADKLLAGNEQALPLSVEDMLAMLKETF